MGGAAAVEVAGGLFGGAGAQAIIAAEGLQRALAGHGILAGGRAGIGFVAAIGDSENQAGFVGIEAALGRRMAIKREGGGQAG